jgi:hypothetical protein
MLYSRGDQIEWSLELHKPIFRIFGAANRCGSDGRGISVYVIHEAYFLIYRINTFSEGRTNGSKQPQATCGPQFSHINYITITNKFTANPWDSSCTFSTCKDHNCYQSEIKSRFRNPASRPKLCENSQWIQEWISNTYLLQLYLHEKLVHLASMAGIFQPWNHMHKRNILDIT